MYTVATFVFAKATGLSFLTVIPPVAWRHGGHFHWNDARVGQPCLCRERNAITRRFLAMHGMSDKCGDEASGENKQGNLKHE